MIDDRDHAPDRIEGELAGFAERDDLALREVLPVRDYEDKDDQRQAKKQRRNYAAHEQMGDRDRAAGRDRVEDHVVRWRHEKRLQRAGNRDVDRKQPRITELDHLRDHYTADRRRVRHRRTGNTAEHRRGDDVDERHAAANRADENLGEIDQPARHAADGHDCAGQDEERNGKQRKPAHAAGNFEHHRFERNAGVERAEDRGDAERVGDRHAHEADDCETTNENKDVHVRRLYSVVSPLTVSASGSEKNFWVRKRSIMNNAVSPPPTGIGR